MLGNDVGTHVPGDTIGQLSDDFKTLDLGTENQQLQLVDAAEPGRVGGFFATFSPITMYSDQFYILLHGGPGLGKTYLIRRIVKVLKTIDVRPTNLYTTGAATRYCSGTTLHDIMDRPTPITRTLHH